MMFTKLLIPILLLSFMFPIMISAKVKSREQVRSETIGGIKEQNKTHKKRTRKKKKKKKKKKKRVQKINNTRQIPQKSPVRRKRPVRHTKSVRRTAPIKRTAPARRTTPKNHNQSASQGVPTTVVEKKKPTKSYLDWSLYGLNKATGDIFNAKARYTFQYWKPSGIDGADYKTTTLNFLTLDAKFFQGLWSVHYETSFGDSNLIEQKEMLAERGKPKSGWEKFVTEFDMPINWVIGKAKIRFFVGYSEEIFTAKVIPHATMDKYYIHPDNQVTDSEGKVGYRSFEPGEQISVVTTFQDYYFGFRFNSPLRALGFVYVNYEKPYSIQGDGIQAMLPFENIYDVRFRAYALFANFKFKHKNWRFQCDGKFGMGSMFIKHENIYIEDHLDADSTMFYGDILAKISYVKYFLYDMLAFNISAQVRYRTFFQSFADEQGVDENGNPETEYNEETGEYDPVMYEIDDVNWNRDFIFTIYAGLTFSF